MFNIAMYVYNRYKYICCIRYTVPHLSVRDGMAITGNMSGSVTGSMGRNEQIYAR